MRPTGDLNRGQSLLRVPRRDIVDRWEHIVLGQVDPKHRAAMRELLNIKYEHTKRIEQEPYMIEWPVLIAKKESTAKKMESQEAVLKIANCLAEFCEEIVQGPIQQSRKNQAVLCLKLVGLYVMTTVKIYKSRKGAYAALSRAIFCGLTLRKLMRDGWRIDLNFARSFCPGSIWTDLERTLGSQAVDCWDRAVKRLENFSVDHYLTHQHDRRSNSPRSRRPSVSQAYDDVAQSIENSMQGRHRLPPGYLSLISKATLQRAVEANIDPSHPALADISPVSVMDDGDEKMTDVSNSNQDGRMPRKVRRAAKPSSRSPHQYSNSRSPRTRKQEEPSPEPFSGLDGRRVQRNPLIMRKPSMRPSEALAHVSGSLQPTFEEVIYPHHPRGSYDTWNGFFTSSSEPSIAPSLATSLAPSLVPPSTPSSMTSLNTDGRNSIASPPPHLLTASASASSHYNVAFGGVSGQYMAEIPTYDFDIEMTGENDVEMPFAGNNGTMGAFPPVTREDFQFDLLQQQQQQALLLQQQFQQQQLLQQQQQQYNRTTGGAAAHKNSAPMHFFGDPRFLGAHQSMTRPQQ